MSDMVFKALFDRMNVSGITAHGFRSTFRDWAGDATNFAREDIEAALAHRLKDKAEAAYRRGDALEKRHALMEAWAVFLEGREGNVLAFAAKA
jgi:integrase